MKKLILMLSLITCTQVFSQTFDSKLGGRFALGQSMFDKEIAATQQNGRLASSIGFTSYVSLNKYLFSSVGLQLTSRGNRVTGSDTTYDIMGNVKSTTEYLRTFQLYYVELPILVGVGLPMKENLRFNLFAGPSINFSVVSATESKTGGTSTYPAQDVKSVKAVQYDLIYGGSFALTSSSNHVYFLDFRYNMPLTTAFKEKNQDLKIQYFSIGLGFLY